MNSVQVLRSDLLAKLKVNRHKHIMEYEEAVKGHREACRKEIDEAIEELNARHLLLDQDETPSMHAICFEDEAPISQESQYDTAIAMLELSVDETITLSRREFRAYIEDEWEWTSHVRTINAKYSGLFDK